MMRSRGGSNVDETLFGNSGSVRSVTLSTAGSIITASDLDRIRSSLVQSQHGNQSRSNKQRRAEISKMRKTRMQAADDARLKAKAQSGQAAAEEVEEIRKKIARTIPDHDLTKAVRSLEVRAVALAGRTAQIEAKQVESNRDRRREQQFHKSLMQTRSRGLRQDARDAEARRQKNAADAASLREQIEAREYAHLLELERVENEGILLRQQMAKQAEVERQMAAKRAEAARVRMQELTVANRDSLKAREAEKHKEVQMDRIAMRWMREKAEKERLEEEAELKRREALEKETARLRAMQERATDEKAAQDAERAKRHMEEVELKRRAKARAKVLAAQQRQRECDTMVEIQLRERAQRKRQAAAVDRAVVRHQVAEDRVARRKEQLAEEARVARNLQHQAELLEQIANKDARQRIVVNEKYEQRKQVMLEARIERELLEKMKVEAIRKLEREQGIDPKWAQDILKVSVVLK